MQTLRKWSPAAPAKSVGKPSASFFKTLQETDIMTAIQEESDKSLMETGKSEAWHQQSLDQRKALVRGKAWQLATVPVKTLAMNVLMIYMTGGGGGIFAFIILGYAIVTAVRILLAANKTFDDLQTSAGVPINFILQRLTYILLALLMLGYFLYQAAQLGLLPTSSDVDFSGTPPTLSKADAEPHFLLSSSAP